jgi:hypothetical protein
MPAGGIIRQTTGDLTVQEFAPRSCWSEMSDSEHFVQFYETDEFLLNSLGGYVGEGLAAGDACIVVATKAHRDALDGRLKAQGLDVAAAIREGQYISLDALETLSRFMVDGQPEPGRFAEVIQNVLARAAINGRRVRAFGEMVALLWAEDNQQGAIRLEELWNDLQKTHAFKLFCAYPMNGFSGEEFFEPLSNVCTAHSRVIPTESYYRVAATGQVASGRDCRAQGSRGAAARFAYSGTNGANRSRAGQSPEGRISSHRLA